MLPKVMKTKEYSLFLSILVGAGALCVGLLPRPMIFVAGGLVMVLFVAAAVYYRKWRWIPAPAKEAKTAVFSVGCVTVTTVLLLFRGLGAAWVVSPLLSVAAAVGVYLHLSKNGRLSLKEEG